MSQPPPRIASDEVQPLPVPPAGLGESPFWHPGEGALYWVDIPGRRLHRFDPREGAHRQWPLPADPGCCAPAVGGGLVLGLRTGVFHFDTADGALRLLAPPPYDEREQRCNDGRADPSGRFWVATIHEPRDAPRAALYRLAGGRLDAAAGGATVGNGIAFSPDARALYWSDTTSHRVFALALDLASGAVSAPRVLAAFEPRRPGEELERYGGRPDGAAVDVEGAYWAAMFEGARLVRLSPAGVVLGELPLPVRCPTMPCFGDADLRTLYITTARHNRPADELARTPWAGCVLRVRVEVPGLPVNFAVA